MWALKEVILVFGIFALESAAPWRLVRSPDKMELDIPHHSLEKESGEYQENMQAEAEYWHEQGDKLGEKESEGHENINEEREKNQENYDHEKEHYSEQQHNFSKEMNETYQEDRDKMEAHHQDNQEHYNQHHNDTNHDFQNQPNLTMEDLTDTETGDRYGEKGTEYINEGEDKVENYDLNGDSPSFSYTRT